MTKVWGVVPQYYPVNLYSLAGVLNKHLRNSSIPGSHYFLINQFNTVEHWIGTRIYKGFELEPNWIIE